MAAEQSFRLKSFVMRNGAERCDSACMIALTPG